MMKGDVYKTSPFSVTEFLPSCVEIHINGGIFIFYKLTSLRKTLVKIPVISNVSVIKYHNHVNIIAIRKIEFQYYSATRLPEQIALDYMLSGNEYNLAKFILHRYYLLIALNLCNPRTFRTMPFYFIIFYVNCQKDLKEKLSIFNFSNSSTLP